MISVIEQSTSERMKEIVDLFDSIKPFLDDGFSYHQSLIKVGRINKKSKLNARTGWFRDLLDYGKTQGYNYYMHKF